jgi:hypothetical protein
MKRIPFILILFTLFTLGANPASATEAGKVVLDYNPDKDTITLQAEQASLKDLLGRIALKTGIEVHLDPLAEQSVTMNINDMPLERALKNLLKDSNNIFRYSSKKEPDGSLNLIGVRVLQAGSAPSAAEQIIALKGEAFIRGKKAYMHDQLGSEQRQRANERWQERLSELPENVQKELLDHAEKKLDRGKQRREAKQQKKEAKDAASKERKAQKEARRYEGLTPEEREKAIALKEQQREMVRQRHIDNPPPQQ